MFAVERPVLAFEVTTIASIASIATIAPTFSPSTPNASECAGGITTFQACSSMVSTLSECNAITVQSAQSDCFCRQDVFNLFYG